MTTTEPAPSRLRRLASGLALGGRTAVRQLATAVYLYIAFALLSRRAPGYWAWAVEVLLVLLGALLYARVVEGGLAATALVGVLFGALDLGLGLAMEGAPDGVGPALARAGVALAVPGLAGLLGAVLGRRWRRSPKAPAGAAPRDAPRD